MADNQYLFHCKKSAKLLHKLFKQNDQSARDRVYAHRKDRADEIQHKDCLFTIAREEGFRDWLELAEAGKPLTEQERSHKKWGCTR